MLCGVERAGGDRTGAVLELHRLLVEDTPPEVVREIAVEQVAALLGGPTGLWLLEDDEIVLVGLAHPDPVVEAEMRTLTGGVLRAPHRFQRKALDSGLDQVVLDAEQLARSAGLMEPAYQEFFARHPARTMVLRPLRFGGTVLGLLGVAREDRPFDDDELRLLGHLGYVVAVVLQAVRYADQQQRLVLAAQRHGELQERLAQTDDLTALLNRRGFSRALPGPTDALDRAVGIVVLDLDDFKAVSDSFGHATGDALLMSVAAQLGSVLPPGAVAARTGGDEFAVLLRADDGDAVRRAVRSMAEQAPPSVRILGVEVPLRGSAGLVVCKAGVGFDPARALQHADVAMYRAKRDSGQIGTVRVAEYDEALDAAALQRLPAAARLRTGIAVGELVLHVQRLVPARGTEQRERVEALVRWDRDGVLVPPGDFLPLATEIGVLPELTAAVLDAAVVELVRWAEAGRDVTVSVNVPASVLAQPAFLDGVLQRLADADLPTDAVELEVTETELVHADAQAALRRARELGIAVAVDDFGTGYSALAALLDVPLTTVKVDRALVAGIHEDQVRRVLVRHCVRFCHELGLRVVAEGVETQAEQDVLTGLGVDLLQGFHLHRPCPPDALPR
jgi:diguanylate cyclase (GGDEF)-like protein